MANVDKRSSERKEAERIWLESNGAMKLAEIAGKLGVIASKIRKWKASDGWDEKLLGMQKPPESKKKQVERSTENAPLDEKRSTKNAPLERERSIKNAPLPGEQFNQESEEECTASEESERHKGGQPGNRNAWKHGGYSQIFWDTLDEEEKEMVMAMPDDEEQMFLDEIRLFTARERRIMQAINMYRNKEDPLSVAGVMQSEEKRSFKTPEDEAIYEQRINEKIEKGERLPGDRINVVTSTEPKDSAIARLEKELSVIQAKKTLAIQALTQLRLEREKISGQSAGNDAADAWMQALMDEDGG